MCFAVLFVTHVGHGKCYFVAISFCLAQKSGSGRGCRDAPVRTPNNVTCIFNALLVVLVVARVGVLYRAADLITTWPRGS